MNCVFSTNSSVPRLEVKSFKSVIIYTRNKSFPTFRSCLKCLILKVAGNRLQSLKQDDLIELYNTAPLNLSDNSITVIEAKSFLNLNNRRILDISGNPLLVISPQSFQRLNRLTHVQISYSHLYDLPLFPQSKQLKLLNVSHSRLYNLNLSLIVSESIILDIQHTNLSWLFSTLNHTKDATILTTLPIICCMLGESVVCKVSGTPQSWCGRPLLMSEKI